MIFRKIIILTTLVVFCKIQFFSQELIPNGSFEEKIKPNKERYRLIDDIPRWNKPILYQYGEYGYFDPRFITRLKNTTLDGNGAFLYDTLGYCYTYLDQHQSTGSVLYTKLNATLIKDSLYDLSFMINPRCAANDTIPVYNESLSLIFSKFPLKDFTKRTLDKNTTTVYQYKPPKYHLDLLWYKVNSQFKAKGSETYLYIIDTKKHQIKTSKNSTLEAFLKERGITYELDNISLKKATKSTKEFIVFMDLYNHNPFPNSLPINKELFCNTCVGTNLEHLNTEGDTVVYTNTTTYLLNKSFISFCDNLIFTLKNEPSLKLKLNVYCFLKADESYYKYLTYRFIAYCCFYGIDENRISVENIDNIDKKFRKDIEPIKYSSHNIGFILTK